MIFYQLPKHSKAVKTITKEIKAKNTKSVFYDPSFTTRASEGMDSLCNVSHYLPIHSKPENTIIKWGGGEAKKQTLQFYVPSFAYRGGQWVNL